MARRRRADELPILLTADMPPEEVHFAALANTWWRGCSFLSSPLRQRAHWTIGRMIIEGAPLVGPLVKHIETSPRV